jgi:hypothetical protein
MWHNVGYQRRRLFTPILILRIIFFINYFTPILVLSQIFFINYFPEFLRYWRNSLFIISPLICRIIAKFIHKYSYSISHLSVILHNVAKCGDNVNSRRFSLPISEIIWNFYWKNNFPSSLP